MTHRPVLTVLVAFIALTGCVQDQRQPIPTMPEWHVPTGGEPSCDPAAGCFETDEVTP